MILCKKQEVIKEFMNEKKQQALFKEYLKESEIIIADKSSASRRRLVKTLCDMGATRNQVHSVAHYSEALDVMDNAKPKLVLSDYKLNGGSGFELFKYYREKFPDENRSVLILVTSNISQSAVAKAAEEDVDSFIIKPYTVKSLEKSLLSAVITKLYPSKYVQKVEEGKEKLFAGSYEESIDIFKEAMNLDKKPSLALFYHGQAKYMQELAEEAEDDYKKGLEVNNIHYKCQVGLYELFKKDGKVFESYDVIKNIAKYFPSNPERLKEVIHLAIKTDNIEDVEMYYELFTELDERPEDVVQYICAGMFVLGKLLMNKKDFDKAKDIIEKASISAAGTAKFLKEYVVLLAQNSFFGEAQKILSRFSTNKVDEVDYAIARFIANSPDMELDEKISAGLELYNSNRKHPYAVELLIDSLRKSGSDKRAQEILEDAKHEWPEKFSNTSKKSAA